MSIPEDARSLRLRFDGTCALCGAAQSRGSEAVWSHSARLIYCTPCAGGAELALSRAGTAGAGAMAVYERRQAQDTAAIRSRWGRLAPVAERMTAPKQSTEAWAKGAVGEQRLAAFLEHELAGEAILIHDRKIPGSKANIDHIAVGPSGVWVIDAKRYSGRVERRDVGGMFRTDVRVFVGGRDQTKRVAKMPRQAEAVRGALDVPEFAEVPVGSALCFTNSDWGPLNLGRPFSIDGVLVTYPGALRKTIREPATLNPDLVGRIAARLATLLQPT